MSPLTRGPGMLVSGVQKRAKRRRGCAAVASTWHRGRQNRFGVDSNPSSPKIPLSSSSPPTRRVSSAADPSLPPASSSSAGASPSSSVLSMSSSSSAAVRPRKRPDLPLITCNQCGRHTVLELEVKSDENGNLGRIFYKCPARKVSVSLHMCS